jgi:endonuclease-3
MPGKRPAGLEAPLRERARAIFRILARTYPGAHCQLNFSGPFQLLCATILSAQCTDRKVNQVTPILFKKYATPLGLARADRRHLENILRSLGLFRSKARNLAGMARVLLDDFKGRVPDKMEDLLRLPGVGRKTANVVLFNAFGLPGLAVDTHVLRVGRRLGLFRSSDPQKVEWALKKLLPSRSWGRASHWLIWHGRRLCAARHPQCPLCPLRELCRFYLTSSAR